jgi:hypothetical protein
MKSGDEQKLAIVMETVQSAWRSYLISTGRWRAAACYTVLARPTAMRLNSSTPALMGWKGCGPSAEGVAGGHRAVTLKRSSSPWLLQNVTIVTLLP